MKGRLVYIEPKDTWVVEFKEDGRDVFLEVRPNRIDDLNRVGTYLQNLQEIDFQIENTHEFPYRWAVPYVKQENEEEKSITEPKKKMVKKKRVTLWLSGFHTDEVEIDCEGYDCSSSGYWYFHDKDERGNRIYLGAYPVGKTIINQIEEIEVEI